MLKIWLHALSSPRRSRIFATLMPALTVAIIIAINTHTAPLHQALDRGLVLILLLLSLAQLRRGTGLWLCALPTLCAVALDTALTSWAWRHYHAAFSYGFAQSVLDTSAAETFSMLRLYRDDCGLFLAILLTLLLSVRLGPQFSGRYRRWPGIALLLVMAGYSAQAVLHQLRSNNLQSPVQRVLSSTPLSNANVFLQAWQDQQIIAAVTGTPPHYALTVSDTGIDTYVLIIGESERTANMHLYGYGRDTTPQLDAQRRHLLLFRQAVSGAPVTIMAVPLALTADTPEHHDTRHYRDNLMAVAKQAGFKTYWFSHQGSGGAHNNVITAIASGADQKQWVNDGYDDALLPLFYQALRKPGKKLIVLHLYGSHENACDRYPANAAVFSGGNPADDCYDNSVHFTDALLGQVFAALQNTRASVLYFSDHALIRDPDSDVVYQHAGTTPPHEALQVPMFIWFSPQVAAADAPAGEFTPLWSTVHNNRLAETWLGIHRQGEPQGGLSQTLRHYAGKTTVMDTTGRTFDWHDLPVQRVKE
ncbi:phosphoethanolamine transferase [Citrobacter werkmanii]|uniref:phosphoethanolamine transferase n=1 Tax=Citrobacter werkmanii TaxID=67827 RepID=UPI002653AD31|nr:phosphoethanolamine transferase [Citrobacter werkmanii]MDN8559090.1 phosphoethanolamine transferase [Citrobacter werkmanii]